MTSIFIILCIIIIVIIVVFVVVVFVVTRLTLDAGESSVVEAYLVQTGTARVSAYCVSVHRLHAVTARRATLPTRTTVTVQNLEKYGDINVAHKAHLINTP